MKKFSLSLSGFLFHPGSDRNKWIFIRIFFTTPLSLSLSEFIMLVSQKVSLPLDMTLVLDSSSAHFITGPHFRPSHNHVLSSSSILQLRSTAARNLKEAVTRYNWTDSSSKYSRLIDDLQSTLHCCGFNSSADWSELNPNPRDSTLLPSSCCARPSTSNSTTSLIICHVPGTGSPALSTSFGGGNQWNREPSATEAPQVGIVYTSNCVDTAGTAIIQSIAPIGGACLAIALFQLLGIIFAFCLSRAVKQEYQVV